MSAFSYHSHICTICMSLGVSVSEKRLTFRNHELVLNQPNLMQARGALFSKGKKDGFLVCHGMAPCKT